MATKTPASKEAPGNSPKRNRETTEAPAPKDGPENSNLLPQFSISKLREHWVEKVIWLMVGALISNVASFSSDAIRNHLDPNTQTIQKRSGMWHDVGKQAHMLIQDKKGKPICVFVGVEGYWIDVGAYSDARWYGKWICENTGSPSGEVIIDDFDNGLHIVVDQYRGPQLSFNFKSVESGKSAP